MAFGELESHRVATKLAAFLGRTRPPPAIRHELDLVFRVEDQSVVLAEVRPAWRGPEGATTETGIAKATYVRRHEHWRVYWRRGDLRWHRYDPAPEVASLDVFLDHVERDEYACFFG